MRDQDTSKRNNSKLKQIGVIEKSDEHGWHMKTLVPWEELGEGTKVYVAVEFNSLIDKIVNFFSRR